MHKEKYNTKLICTYTTCARECNPALTDTSFTYEYEMSFFVVNGLLLNRTVKSLHEKEELYGQ